MLSYYVAMSSPQRVNKKKEREQARETRFYMDVVQAVYKACFCESLSPPPTSA